MDILSAVPFSALESSSTTKQSKKRNVRKASWRGISCGARGQQWDTKPQPRFECAPEGHCHLIAHVKQVPDMEILVRVLKKKRQGQEATKTINQ